MNRTLKQNVVFTGNLEGAPRCDHEHLGAIGGGVGGAVVAMAESTRRQISANQVAAGVIQFRAGGKLISTNQIEINAVPITP